MKSISELTYPEKVSQVLNYHACRSERTTKLRYLLAIRRDDKEQTAYFESFGKSIHQIMLNVRTYERGLLFGYTSRNFNEYGWITGMLPIIEQIELETGNYIHIGQSINGTYAVTISWSTGGAGGGSHPSVWDKPINSYVEAVRTGIRQLEERYNQAWRNSSDSFNYSAKTIRRLLSELQEIKRKYLEPQQLSLFA